jgi:hypothetical protein
MSRFEEGRRILGVVAAKAGTHNHRRELLREMVVSSSFAPIAAGGHGSRIYARRTR